MRRLKDKIIMDHDRCTASNLEHPGTEMAAMCTASRTRHTLAVTALLPSGWCAEAGVPGVLTDGLVANIADPSVASERKTHC